MSNIEVVKNSGLFIGNADVAPASGTVEITENGVYDVAKYATADVQTPVPTGKINITENGTDINIAGYALADVDVPQGIFPSGMLMITQNGVHNVEQYAMVNVSLATNDDLLSLITVITTMDSTLTLGYTNTIQLGQIGIYDVQSGTYYSPFSRVETLDFGRQQIMGLYDAVFSNTLITDLNVPHNFSIYGSGGFANNNHLENVVFNGDLRASDSDEVETFANCPSLDSVVLGTYINKINRSMFYNSPINTLYILNSNFSEIMANGLDTVNDIYFVGSQNDWANVTIDASIDLTNTNLHYDYVPT